VKKAFWGHVERRPYAAQVTVSYEIKRRTRYEAQTNTGIAGVVPVWKVMDLLMTPKLVEERAQEDEELKKKLEHLSETFILDLAKEHKGEEFTQSDVEEALRLASRRVASSRSGS
jgi:hypothetical protein